MIRHVVLMRWHDDATPEQVEAARAALLAMPRAMPFIRAIEAGPNRQDTRDEWPFGLLVTLDDMAAVDAYLAHPEHVRVVQTYLAPIRAGRLVIDLEVA